MGKLPSLEAIKLHKKMQARAKIIADEEVKKAAPVIESNDIREQCEYIINKVPAGNAQASSKLRQLLQGNLKKEFKDQCKKNPGITPEEIMKPYKAEPKFGDVLALAKLKMKDIEDIAERVCRK